MIVIIPARGGSKGVPYKNHRPFNDGASLVRRAIQCAMAVSRFIYVSTDDPLIAADAALSVPVIPRPAHLAQDDTPMLPVIQHAMGWLKDALAPQEPEFVMTLQPTQPLRTATHLQAAYRILSQDPKADSVVSVVEIPAHYSPAYACNIQDGELIVTHTVRRQDARTMYSRDGTVYLTRVSALKSGSLYGKRCIPLIIPSAESVNIDTEEDWVRAEGILRRRNLT